MSTDVQTCYRHDDRRAGVHCQRCDRPICPSCMTQASVGFHCPECLRRGTQQVRTARQALAGTTPYVTYVLIAVNVAMHFASESRPRLGDDLATVGLLAQVRGVLVGATSCAGLPDCRLVGVAEGEWYRILTGGFLHAGLTHLAFNMFALYVLGRQLEGALGARLFAGIYFASLMAGSFGVLLLDPNAVTVGASGAVFGLFGYALAAQRSRGINPMDTGLGGIIILNLAFTFLIPGISKGGHIGGLVGGLVVGAVVELLARRQRWPISAVLGAVAGLTVVFAGLAVAVGTSL